MRKRLSGALAVVASVGVATAVAVAGGATSPAGAATAAGTYTWHNVAIGGGGFIPGIIFNQTQPNLAYVRTDIGGAYRWDQATGSWIPLLDWVGQDNWGYNGVVSLATDPINTNRVFAAVGMYTNSFDPNDGAVLRSADEGDTWQVSKLPFKLGGNMPGRGMGERLAIDPNDDNILYLGAPSGHGLWRSTDGGVTWSQVANFPNVGDYVQDPTDTTGYASDNQGVTWVTFDQSTGTKGSPTQGIYVGVADLQNTVYRSTDGGATWQRIAGQPTGFMAHKGLIDPVNDELYIATSDKGGPYDGSSGDVWKYAIKTGTWTRISPYPSSDTSNDYYGYSGLALDPEHPGTVMVTGYSSWWPDTFIWRSTDGGSTWSQIWNWTTYPNRNFNYTLDTTSEPWLNFGNTAPVPPVTSPELGWMTEALAIDPFNSNRMFYGTGATLYGTTDLTDWDIGGKITVKPFVHGLEETAVNALISPPTGPPLVSALSDLDGFVHTDINAVPKEMFTSPTLTSGDSLDFAELNPSDMVRTGEVDKSANPNTNRIGFSTDGGTDWFQGQEPPGVTGGGTAVMAADGSSTVWSPAGAGVYFSTSFGGSWTASTGIPQGAVLASDRVNPTTFYGFSGGKFYVSTNRGASFTATGAIGLPADGKVFVKAVAGHAGDVWLAGGAGLWHSTDGGATFTKLSTVDSSLNVGFGKAAPGQTYPALYAIATVSGVAGVFRSDDEGATWVRINDDRHQYGNIGQAITGDPNVYGRVYLGTNGRGIVYGDLTGTTAPPPTTTAAPPPSTTVAPPPTTTTVAPPPTAGAACQVTYARSDEWAGGFIANLTLTNTGGTPLNGWTVAYSFPGDQQVTSAWNAAVTQAGTRVTAVNESYNATVAPGGSVSFGFQGTWTSDDTSPAHFTVNGTACSTGP